ncbi:MAG TPA: hypothetical protein PK289_11600 [Bacteroidia bacterium]|nr:hypothetical protein [Bacteroidia bacterium]
MTLQEKLDFIKQSVLKLKLENATLKQRLADAEDQTLQSEVQLDELNSKMKQLLNENRLAAENFSNASAEVDKLNQMAKKLAEELSTLRNENDNLKQENAVLIGNLNNHAQKLQSIESEKMQMASEYEKIQSVSLEVEIQKQQSAELLQNALNELEMERNNVRLLQQEKETLSTRMSEIEEERSKLQNQLNDVNNTLDSLNLTQNQTAGWEAEREGLTTEKSQLQQQIRELNVENRQLSDKMNQIRSTTDQLLQTVDNQTDTIKDLEDQLKFTKIAETISLDSSSKHELKLKINEMIREIDRCIAKLSN